MPESKGADMKGLSDAAYNREDTGRLRALLEALLHPKMMANRELRLIILGVMDEKNREEDADA